MEELKYCEGCGALLQTEDPAEVGYIPSSTLEKDQLICQRCFRIKHYNEVQPVQVNENDFLQILHRIDQTDSLVIQVLDLFDIDGTFIAGLPRFIGKNPYIMVANKIDLFPKSIHHNRIKHWLTQYAREHGLYPEEIFLISAEKNTGLDDLTKYIEQNRKEQDVIVIGATNVGKSSLINRLIPLLQGKKKTELTTSRFPGTTLNTVSIPLKDGYQMVDTPGVVHKERFIEWVTPNTLKIISPRKQMKPTVFQLHGQQTLFIGGLARIDQTGNTDNSFVCYFSNEIPIHRTKLEKADLLYQQHLGELLSPPSKDEAATFPPLIKHSFKVTTNKKKDIVISGLGWITIDGDNTSVDIYAPKGIGVHIREALI